MEPPIQCRRILLSLHMLGAMSVDAQSEFQLIALVQALERFTQKPRCGLNLSVTSPKGIHAVGRVKHEQNSGGQRFFVGGHLTPTWEGHPTQRHTKKPQPSKGRRLGLRCRRLHGARKHGERTPESVVFQAWNPIGPTPTRAARRSGQCRATCVCLP